MIKNNHCEEKFKSLIQNYFYQISFYYGTLVPAVFKILINLCFSEGQVNSIFKTKHCKQILRNRLLFL